MSNVEKKPFVWLFVLLLLCGCVGTTTDGRPAWVTSPYDRQYDEKTYLCAVGSGTTREQAVNAAFSSLSQIFHADVESNLSYLTTSSVVQEGSEDERYLTSDFMIAQGGIATKTQDIVGVQVVNTWIDEQQNIWVRVALHRKTAAQGYQEEMEVLENDIARLRTEASSAKGPLQAYASLHKAFKAALHHWRLGRQVSVLTGKTQKSYLEVVKEELDNASRRVSLSVDVHASTPYEQELAREQLESAFASLCAQYGFTVTTDKMQEKARLAVTYTAVPLTYENSPYAYARYELSVQLHEGGNVIVSYQTSERVAALTEGEALQKALQSAGSQGVIGLTEAIEQ